MIERYETIEHLTNKEGYELMMHNFFKSIENDEEKRKRAKIISDSFINGFENEENTIGLHGMSIEALIHLIENGHFAGIREHDATDFSEINDLYLFPITENLEGIKFEKEDDFDRLTDTTREKLALVDAYESCESYANTIAKAHFVAAFLKTDNLNFIRHRILGNMGFYSGTEESIRISLKYLFDKLGYEELQKELEKEKIDIDSLVQAITLAQKRKGLIVLIDKQVANDHTITEGDHGGDLRIKNGPIEIKHVIGIDSLGRDEAEFLEKLRTKTGSN